MIAVPRRSIESAGFTEVDAAARAALVAQAGEALRQRARTMPVWAWFVPGRIEVVGKHTDYAGGLSLVAAVPRGVAVVAAPRSDGRVTVIDARWPGRVVVDVHRPAAEAAARGWGRYVAAVVERFARNFAGRALGTDIAIAGDLPRAAGLSSSSALIVGLALAMMRRARLADSPEWQSAITSTLDLAGYLGSVEAGRSFGIFDAAGGVGTEGGSEDHTAILASVPERLRVFSYVPAVTLIDQAPMPADWTFVVMTSGVRANKAGQVRDKYNRAAQAARVLVELWERAGGPPRTLGELTSRPDELARLQRVIEQHAGGPFPARDLLIRLAHFVHEHGRVLDVLDAFRQADSTRLGQLSAASQQEAEQLLDNQVAETIALARAAREAGAFAASSFGAGFGGSVWALVDLPDPSAFADRWRRHYLGTCPDVETVEWFAARPGPGAFEVDRPA